MADPDQTDNDVKETTSSNSESSQVVLTGPYLNAEGLLRRPLPKLKTGDFKKETVSYAPSITHRYQGDLAPWDTFKDEVRSFYKDPRTKAELQRCAKAPIYMDPAVESINSEAMTRETVQCGAEITVSGRYFHNALAVVTSIVRTLVVPAHGPSANPGFLSEELAFGDSWILDQEHRVRKQEPDIFLKLPIGGKDQVRLVGELKFCLTVNFTKMVDNHKIGNFEKLRAILGQLVNYMLGHKLKYAFISNYDETIFLQLDQRKAGQGEACIYFSDIIRYDDAVDESKEENISLRLALLYLIHKTCSPATADWCIPDHIDTKALKEDWITRESIFEDKSGTPYGHRAHPAADRIQAISNTLPTPQDLLVPPRTPQNMPAANFQVALRPRQPTGPQPQPSDRVLRSRDGQQ
ncbi:hypothetical protein P3342_013326 [Pyrenophora teres f. teres]|nr:hypothetical protein P3342_013326 [Pyrenophora teres f. teres]